MLSGGSDGGGGDAGSNGGDGGAGGSGEGGAGGVGACSRVVPEAYDDVEANDIVQAGTVIGHVEGFCPGLPCEGADPFDQWVITTCGGPHRVLLTWDEEMHNLNLFLHSLDETDDWSSQGTNGMSEQLTEDLAANQQYIIQVQAADTRGNTQTYNLAVTPVD